MRKFVFLIGLLMSQLALAQVYRWVDADGVVHFSDRPVEGAERVEMPEAPATVSRPVARPQPAGSTVGGEEGGRPENGVGYKSLTIVQPSDEETLWNIGATLDVSLNLVPSLRSGHEIEVWFDGSILETQDPRSLSLTVSDVYRGRHNLWARIVDASDRVLIQSNEVTFYVQQTSIANPP